MTPAGQISDAAIRDTLAAVFAGEEFTSVARETLFSRIIHWIGEILRELQRLTGESRLLYYTVLIAAVLLVVGIIARAVYVAYAGGALGGQRARLFSGAARGDADDPWSRAQRLAAEGDFTAAAHALYGAVLLNVSSAGLVRLHDAKTIGDYLREMRARASARLVQTFREFSRGYEHVVYGLGECDRARYERLYGLASQIVSDG
ncbi:MAG TPA: DUF4129 domain-containing protein [Gemmatimonadaceae bacterium]|nr:DUF4129 domain-containing protein [Gemmatimonadaceae bacterium]